MVGWTWLKSKGWPICWRQRPNCSAAVHRRWRVVHCRGRSKDGVRNCSACQRGWRHRSTLPTKAMLTAKAMRCRSDLPKGAGLWPATLGYGWIGREPNLCVRGFESCWLGLQMRGNQLYSMLWLKAMQPSFPRNPVRHATCWCLAWPWAGCRSALSIQPVCAMPAWTKSRPSALSAHAPRPSALIWCFGLGQRARGLAIARCGRSLLNATVPTGWKRRHPPCVCQP